MKRMWKRGLALVCVLALCLGIFPVTAMAADLPDGWWPYWSAYENAVSGGDKAEILRTGDAVEQFYAKYPQTCDIGHQLYQIYWQRLSALYFEEEGNYTAALANTTKLKNISQYLTNNGFDRKDMILICENHLKLLEPHTGVYAVSYTQSNTYGSAVASPSGTYYGSINDGNFAQNGEAGVVAFYVELEYETAKQFDYEISKYTSGDHVIQINLNFKYEGSTARAVSQGTYDDNLKTTLNYLATLKCPVIMRIGGEMNVWDNAVTPNDFIAAYNYIGKMARSLAPKVELVWSPNFASSWGVDVADYYPDNNYVDWVGMSLYYNYDNDTDDGTVFRQEAILCGRFADVLTHAEDVMNVARAHNKPVAITEGGAAQNGSQGVSFAAKQVGKALSTLTMVYPEVKSIVFFDREYNGNDYSLTGSVMTAARNAINGNPTLLGSGQKQAGTYVPLEDFSEKADKLVLGATGRTYNNMDLTVEYRLDQKWLANGSGSPNQYVLNLKDLTPGAHKLEVIFRDGSGYTETKTYVLLYAEGKLSCYTPDELYTDCIFSEYYYPAVLWVRENDNAVGASGSSFYPTNPCTRGQAVEFIWGAYGRPEPTTTENPFPDVSPSDSYYKAVLWAVENGVTNGKDGGFKPNDTCSRAEIVTFLWRALGKPEPTTTNNPFTDTPDDWYQKSVLWAVENGVTNGTGTDTFSPNNKCQRAQIVTFLYRAKTN